MTTVEALSLTAKRIPDKIAAIANEKEITYADLWKKVQGFAAYLNSLNLEKQAHVVVKADSDIWFLVSCLAVNLSGCVHIPLEKTIPDDGLKNVAAELKAAVIISNVENLNSGVVEIDSNKILELADENYKEGLEFSFPDPEYIADILFTTGTTGKSKGVMNSHRMIAALNENVIGGISLNENHIFLIPTPINHAAGIRKFYACMRVGATIVLVDGYKDLKKFYNYIAQYKVNAIYMPPTAIRMVLMVSSKELAKYKDQIDFFYTSAAALPEVDKEKLIELLPNTHLFFAYGSSESGSSCLYDCAKYRNKVSCIGKQLKNTNLFIVDDDRNPIQSSKDNQGLIAVKSPANMTGYYNEPELTKEVLDQGIVYTNDVGYIDEEGFVYMLGRRGDVINVGGLKIAPTEVENVVLRFPGVSEAACFAKEDRMGAVVPKLNIVPKEGVELDLTELRTFMAETLEAYKIPKLMEIVAEIPKTANGKINRKVMK